MEFTLYTSFPTDPDQPPAAYRRSLVHKLRWIEQAGCRGVLAHTDNRSLDPWAAAQFLIENTERLVPLVAVNPAYMHPYSAARAVSSIAYLYQRQLDLNLVSGGFPGHLRELGDSLEHDARYERLAEYAEALTRLLTAEGAASYQGAYYTLRGARLGTPSLDAALLPRIYVSGGSEASLEARARLALPWLTYPRMLSRYADTGALKGAGVRFGIIARETTEQAWAEARARFPRDEQGEELHDWASTQVESQWHLNLSQDVRRLQILEQVYWLYPFRAYHTFCPFLVGTYDEVADALAEYARVGVSTLILDAPTDPDDMAHAQIALRKAETAG